MTRTEFEATFVLQYGHTLGTDQAIQQAKIAADAIYGKAQ